MPSEEMENKFVLIQALAVLNNLRHELCNACCSPTVVVVTTDSGGAGEDCAALRFEAHQRGRFEDRVRDLNPAAPELK